MARTSIYLNFPGTTEAAFNFYKSVFGTEFIGEIHRIGGNPLPEAATLSDEEKNMIMHIELPILGGLVLMGTDVIPSMRHTLTFGDNVSLNLEPDTKEEADRLFSALVEGGKSDMPLTDMFWGGYFGSCVDRFGVLWMFNVSTA